MASTGTPSPTLHPAEGIHGDLRHGDGQDVVLAFSNSGETGEIVAILPSLRRIGAKIIAVVGNADSTLAHNADLVLDVTVEKEACPLGLAPTTSTTVALALGDALAVALMEHARFTADRFAIFHPGGALGRRLLLTVGDVTRCGGQSRHHGGSFGGGCLFVMTEKGLGAASNGGVGRHAAGLVTDGDIRRGLKRERGFLPCRSAGWATKAAGEVRNVWRRKPCLMQEPWAGRSRFCPWWTKRGAPSVRHLRICSGEVSAYERIMHSGCIASR